jgi:hypothetical protein
MILVELFSSGECRLCDEARTVLERVRKALPFTLSEIRLHEGDPLFDEYREMVPVVHINRVPAFRYRVHEGMLRIRLQQIASGGSRPATEEEANSGELLP